MKNRKFLNSRKRNYSENWLLKATGKMFKMGVQQWENSITGSQSKTSTALVYRYSQKWNSETQVKTFTSVQDYLYRELKTNIPYYAEQLRYREKILSSPFCSHIDLNSNAARRGNWRTHNAEFYFWILIFYTFLRKFCFKAF